MNTSSIGIFRLAGYIAVALLLAPLASRAQTATVTTLHSFTLDDAINGISPNKLVQGIDGNFYGTCGAGGNGDNGTIFKITPDGTLTTLHRFGGSDSYLTAPLVQDAAGNLYGTTGGNVGGGVGYGTVFKCTTDGTFTTLHAFSGPDGTHSLSALLLDSDGSLYGTTIEGGANDMGTIFRVAADGTFTTLYNFADKSEPLPLAALVRGPDGALYGTTQEGGDDNAGTVFKLATDGTFTILHSFGATGETNTDGNTPRTALIPDSDGNFYGTTYYNAGTYPHGTAFRISPDGTFTKIHDFPDYATVNGLLRGTDGNLYVTTGAYETTDYRQSNALYLLNTDGSTFMLYSGQCATVIEAADRSFYGAYPNDGFNLGYIFRLDTGLGEGGALSLAASQYYVNENAGSVSVTVHRVGGTGAVAVNYATADGDATVYPYLAALAGVNYTATAGTLAWADGDATDKTIVVPIIDVHSYNEFDSLSFSVTLSGTTNGAVITTPATANISISYAGLEITSPLIASGQVGAPFSYQITDDDEFDLQDGSYTATGLPPGLTLDSSRGAISGTPTTAGVYAVTLGAGYGSPATATLTLTVAPAVPAPVLTSPATAGATVGTAFSYPVTSSDPTAVPGVSGSLPPGVSFDPATALIAGVPTQVGVFVLTLSATNAGGTGTATLTLTVVSVSTLPVVIVSVLGSGETAAGSPAGKVAVRRTGDTSAALTVNYKVKGSAQAGVDYKVLTGSVIIPAGATQAKIKVKPLEGAAEDGALSVKIKLLPDAGYTLGSAATAKIKIVGQQ